MKSTINYLIAFVWLANGLFCKVLHLVPRHQLIVAAILGGQYAAAFTMAIGIAETAVCIWIITGLYSKYCTWLQVIVVAVMNAIEFAVVPHLLLFGKLNALFAFLFIVLVLYHQYGFSDRNIAPAERQL